MITKQLIVYLLACMGLLACSASSVTIEGKDGINRQKEYYLYGCQAGSLNPIASLYRFKWLFPFKGSIASRRFLFIGNRTGCSASVLSERKPNDSASLSNDWNDTRRKTDS